MGRRRKEQTLIQPDGYGNDMRVTKLTTATEVYVEKNKENIRRFRSWVLWYPDLFLDLMRPATGGLRLHMDQRVSMRCDARFFSYYGCFPRGASKSLNQILVCFVLMIVYPGIEIKSMEELERLFEAMKKSYEKETGKNFEEWVNSIDID